MIDQPPQSPLSGKYLVRNPVLNRLLRLTDGLLAPLTQRSRASLPPQPRRILLANGAHLGDVLLSLSMLPLLRDAFPQARLGFLAGSWARCLLEGHPHLDWVHQVDHWKLNRSPLPQWEKLIRYRQTRQRALREIRANRYDVAMDLYYYFPNSIPLLWQANIPCRIGYTSGGFGPLLTHGRDWRLQDRHVTDYHADLLIPLGLAERRLPWQAPLLPGSEGSLPRALRGEVARAGLPATGFVVFHLGTAATLKEWALPHWRQLAERMIADGYALAFTGSAGVEQRKSEAIRAGLARCVNLCGRLAWQEFVAVVRQAGLLVGVDSVAGHVAAAVGTPGVIVSAGITSPAHWKPRGAPCRVLTHRVPCAPCYRSRGCPGMECVRHVGVGEVQGAVREMLINAPVLTA
jgi:ADP-heptose:LPS heptosyltransferase